MVDPLLEARRPDPLGKRIQVKPLAIKVAVADANPVLAQGVCALLERGGAMLAEAVVINFDCPQPITANHPFDIVIFDPVQTKIAPQDLIGRIGTKFGAARCIGYCEDTTGSAVRHFLAAGFRGFLPKTAQIESLLAAVAAVHANALYIDPQYSDAFLEPALELVSQKGPTLTERETYVLRSVANGKSLKEIGQELALSAKTIETYKARGSSKLNLSGRRAIVEYAIRSGWVQ